VTVAENGTTISIAPDFVLALCPAPGWNSTDGCAAAPGTYTYTLTLHWSGADVVYTATLTIT
jgi:hypothetical protein